MLSPENIRQLCQRKYPAFLRALVTGEPFFPLEIRFGRPSTTADWDVLRTEVTNLAEGASDYRIDWVSINTRRWGQQRLPERVWFDGELAYLKTIRKSWEVEAFRKNLAHTRLVCPELNDWLPANAKRIVEYADVWPSLLLVCRYFIEHPRPGLYARELPVPVDTKFIERHASVLRLLLDFLIPASVQTDAERFEVRYGLRHDEPQIRLRLLDPSLSKTLGLPVDDVAIPISRFQNLNWTGLQVVICENKMTFLTLPTIPNGVGVWGAGNAAALLHDVTWLAHCRILYWGDVDAEGLLILSRLRSAFPAVRSVMMGISVLNEFRSLCSTTNVPARPAPLHLTSEELDSWNEVVAHNLRLEQERIPFSYAHQAVAYACNGDGTLAAPQVPPSGLTVNAI